jgi:hypothetical protein
VRTPGVVTGRPDATSPSGIVRGSGASASSARVLIRMVSKAASMSRQRTYLI